MWQDHHTRHGAGSWITSGELAQGKPGWSLSTQLQISRNQGEGHLKGIPGFTGSSGPHQCPATSLALQKRLGWGKLPAHMVLIKTPYEKPC